MGILYVEPRDRTTYIAIHPQVKKVGDQYYIEQDEDDISLFFDQVNAICAEPVSYRLDPNKGLVFGKSEWTISDNYHYLVYDHESGCWEILTKSEFDVKYIINNVL